MSESRTAASTRSRRGTLRAVYEEIAVLRARRGARRLVRRLGLRPHDGLHQLVAAIERRRGRPIVIREAPLPPEMALSGVCVETGEVDIIVVDNSATTPLLRLVITLHELRHLLNDTGGRRRQIVSSATALLERARLRAPRPAAARDPDHALFTSGTLAALTPALPADVVREILERNRPVHMRAPHHDPLDVAEVFSREVITLLALHDDASGTGAITSSLDHRRTGI